MRGGGKKQRRKENLRKQDSEMGEDRDREPGKRYFD